MLNDFTAAERVYIACGYTDIRKGIDGLATCGTDCPIQARLLARDALEKTLRLRDARMADKATACVCGQVLRPPRSVGGGYGTRRLQGLTVRWHAEHKFDDVIFVTIDKWRKQVKLFAN